MFGKNVAPFFFFTSIHKSTDIHFQTWTKIAQNCFDPVQRPVIFVVKDLPSLTGKLSMIFGSAIISTSCSLRAERWENGSNKADGIVLFVCTLHKLACVYFSRNYPRNFSLWHSVRWRCSGVREAVSESEAVIVCVAGSSNSPLTCTTGG